MTTHPSTNHRAHQMTSHAPRESSGMRIGIMAHLSDHTIDAVQLAKAADARGFDSLFVTEHTHVPAQAPIRWRGGEPMPEIYKRLYDPLIGLAAAAAVTSTIKLGTGVLVIGQRDPLALAKQIASLDRISQGRVILGTGYGWLAQELANHGVAWDERRNVWQEHLAALRELWTTDESTFAGQRVRFGPSWSYPKPVQRGIPIWLGSAGSPHAFADVVSNCDGWMPVEGTEPIDSKVSALRRLAEEAGRDPDSISVAVYASAGDPFVLDAYLHAGVTHVVLGIDASSLEGVEQQLQHHQHLLDNFSG
jgi:probable F420-dependent oxidoreductase